MQIVLLIGAVIVAWLVFSWLINIVKVSIKTAVSIALIILVLQFAFGISPQKLWDEVMNLPKMGQQLFQPQQNKK
ncbi:MAG: hypothetical protein VKJ02_06850 [Snowella sp.]|nr:hypothetical protein [Snowella sp.]